MEIAVTSEQIQSISNGGGAPLHARKLPSSAFHDAVFSSTPASFTHGLVASLSNLGMNIDSLSLGVRDCSSRFSPVNWQRMRLSSMNMASCLRAQRAVYRFTCTSDASSCGFSYPSTMISTAAANSNSCCRKPIGIGIRFCWPSYIALDSRLYSQIPRAVSRNNVASKNKRVGTDAFGSESSFESNARLEAKVAQSKKSSTDSTSRTADDSVAKIQSQPDKQVSKPEGQQDVRRSKKKSKKQKLASSTGIEATQSGRAKRSSPTRGSDLAKGETSASAEVEDRVSKDKQEESPLKVNSALPKKGSSRKGKSIKKEKRSPQETNNLNSHEGSTIKPLYPPNGRSVVVVESLTKAKVIQGYLGDMFEVLPSYGHVRDLAARSGSVRPDDDFSMVWEVPSAAWTHLKSIKVALSRADNLILASDPDREGEAVAWHIIEMLRQQDALRDNVVVVRAVFHEITEISIKAALQAPRHIDVNLVNAYLARRALEYLIGINISPILWRKLPSCQSAGRVQSAALSLICDREMEIDEFKPQEYWRFEVEFNRLSLDSTEKSFPIASNLMYFASKKLTHLSISSETEAKDIEENIMSSIFKVAGSKSNKTRKNPPTPYVTSTLQQDAANKLQFPATYTMKLAQKLYEGVQQSDGKAVGLITYIRTDGLHIPDEVVKHIKSFVTKRYGQNFSAKTARKYSKKVKNAQEAHEAIRPTDIQRLPSMLDEILDEDSLKLYSLIWSRTMACQMEPAVFAQIQVDIKSSDGLITFNSSCSKNEFLGYRAAFKDVESDLLKSKDNLADRDEIFGMLNSIKPGDHLTIGLMDLKQHFTQSPSRYSEASLVKKMEELGIGRPSTYASTLKVLQDRNYVTVTSRLLYPEFRGRMVSAFISHHFSEVSDYSFTADMETELDNVSIGITDWKGLLKDYWTRFSSHLNRAATAHIHQVEKMLEKKFGNFLFASLPDEDRTCPSCSEGTLTFKVSRYGAGYSVGCDQHPRCKYIAKILYGEEDEDASPQHNTTIEEPKLIGLHPVSNEKILLKNGPYGFYVQLGEDRKGYTTKRASISQTKDVDSITVEEALDLLRYPVTLGTHPKDGSPVVLKLAKVGFTIRHRRNIADLPKNLKPGDVTLEKALKILSGKDVRRSGRPKGKPRVEDALEMNLF